LKFPILVFYFFRSMFLRGPIHTFKLLAAEISFEKKLGIKTSSFKKSESTEFFHYQGASYLVLQEIFSGIFEQTKPFNFVDIGCGKGRVIFVAEFAGYNHLTGIELDDLLLKVALNNEILYTRKRKSSIINFVHNNALNFDYKNLPTLYFLFNPFSEAVLRKVLEKIVRSTTSETWFVYMNPQFMNPFSEQRIEKVKEFKTGKYLEAVVYKLNRVSTRS